MSKQYFNPTRLFQGIFLPLWLIEREDLTPGAKLTYGILGRFAQSTGEAWPKQELLAKTVGVSKRSVQNHIDELINAGLIEAEQRGLQKSNVYRFVWHNWMGDFTSGAIGENPALPGRKSCHSETQDLPFSDANSALPKEESNSKGVIRKKEDDDARGSVNDSVEVQVAYDDGNAVIAATDQDLQTAHRIMGWIQNSLNSPTPYVAAPVLAWLAWGATFECDIKPTIEAHLAAGRKPPRSSLSYFDRQIAESIQQRTRAMPETDSGDGRPDARATPEARAVAMAKRIASEFKPQTTTQGGTQ